MPPQPLPAPTTKSCAHCHATFTRGTQPNGHPIERRKWLAQTYCSRKCAGNARAEHDTAHLPPTKTCEACGRTYERPRYANGKLQSSGQWLRRKFCSHECQNEAQSKHATHKTCEACGIEYPRKRQKNGKLQSSAQWRKRVACSDACNRQLRKKPTEPKPKRALKEHAPCERCAAPVLRRSGERNGHWHSRKYCSVECGQAAAADHRRKLARERRAQRFAPKRYVFDGKFPTPVTLKGVWQSVSGPDTGKVVTSFVPSRAARCPKTLAALASAIQAHPDLGTALLGELTDSWARQDAAAYHR